ncbi:hemolysin-type calcium-binding repeat family protein [Lyngbya aestuarii BL J]|uniref:Hemolysin-type calcium-binding repeat family protein n=1 Tax=Lyngbya aestuarii BL J TaxID=1348334 RepID=U7QF12_9CYAN|nr:calcium-binding protein [Lyngbya aestuarii]ERT05862.1 hemolysin-type calcium-binding repeat family protein [Lyngbya aestuarii BL J]
MVSILTQVNFFGSVDTTRFVVLGALEDDNIIPPIQLNDDQGNLLTSNADASQLEILLRDGNDIFDGSTLEIRNQDVEVIVVGNKGNDLITGSFGQDSLFGGQDNDDILGGEGDDQLFGNLGDDFVLDGGLGNDSIFGGQNDDYVRGGEGDDQVFGDRGNDIIHGDGGIDLLTGGAGQDQFVIDLMLETQTNDPNLVDTIQDFTSGEDEIVIFGINSEFIEVSNLTSVGSSSGFVLYDTRGGDIGSGREFAIAFIEQNSSLTADITVGTDIFTI